MAIWTLGRVHEALIQAANQVPLDEYEKTLSKVMNGPTDFPN